MMLVDICSAVKKKTQGPKVNVMTICLIRNYMFSGSQTSNRLNSIFSLLAYKDNRKGKRFPEGFMALCVITLTLSSFVTLLPTCSRLSEGLYPSSNSVSMLNNDKLDNNSLWRQDNLVNSFLQLTTVVFFFFFFFLFFCAW